MARSDGDLGMFALDGGATAGPWWMRLTEPEAPKVIARLPFVERPDHPAGMPVYVIAKPLSDGGARQVVLERSGSTAGAPNSPARYAPPAAR